MANFSKGFTLVAGKRASGAPYWLVRGTLGGRQIRREFPARVKALAFIEERNSERFGHPSEQTPRLTRLGPEELRDAELALAQLAREFPGQSVLAVLDYYRRLVPHLAPADIAALGPALAGLRKQHPGVELAEVCAWFTRHYRPARGALTLQVALEHYLADALRRRHTGSLSEWQFNSVGFAMAQLERHFGSKETLADLTTFRLKEYLRTTTKAKNGSVNYSNKTWSNRRGYLTTFFKYCQQENWLDHNPASDLRNYTRKDFSRPTPCVLTLDQARRLMAHLESFAGGRMVPFFVLALFCGIRPTWKHGEIARLKPAQFNLAQAELNLRAEDTKTRRPRVVRLQPNVVDWLTAYPLDRQPIIAANFPKLYFRIRKDFALGYDALRHTYCSMLVGKFRSVGDAALQAGNSEDVIWGSYLNLVSQDAAQAFWEIRPTAKGKPPA